MKYDNLHPWNLSYGEAIKIQQDLRDRIIIEPFKSEPILVAGADVSYTRGSDLFFSSVVILKTPDMTILESANAEAEVDFPYIPGLLSFREAPVLMKAFEKIKNTPDVVMFDGQGIAHPRKIGIASHIGLLLNLPSIGCAKHNLIGDYEPVGTEAGNHTPIVFNGDIVGAVLRTKNNVSPVFVSPGYKMDVPSAIDIVMKTCRGYRLPEPTRQAHILVNKARLTKK